MVLPDDGKSYQVVWIVSKRRAQFQGWAVIPLFRSMYPNPYQNYREVSMLEVCILDLKVRNAIILNANTWVQYI